MRFGFCESGTYQSQSPNVAADRAINLYPESTGGQGGKTDFSLYCTPGLRIFTLLAGGLMRGFGFANTRVFSVCGPNFYEVFSDRSFILRGTVANDLLPVSMASSSTQLLLASGGSVYVFDLMANTLTQVPAVTFQAPFTGATSPVSFVGYSDGFFIALLANTNKYYVSGLLDATDWTTNGSKIISVFPDNILSMLIDHREIWLWGIRQTQVEYDSGNIFPFDDVPGGMIEQGIVAKNSRVKLDNSVYWLGGDERGSGIAWRAQGYTPSRVSNHSVEFFWQSYSRIDDAIGYSYQDQGHSFWVLYFPTANVTWVFDVATGMWHERSYLDQTTGLTTAHRSQCHIFAFGKHLVGDWASGTIFWMNIAFPDDAGNPIQRIRRAPHVSNEQQRIFHTYVQVDMEAGLAYPLPPPGTGITTVFSLQAPNGTLWSLFTNDIGQLQTQSGAFNAPQTIILSNGVVSWQVGVDNNGQLTTNSVAFSALYPLVFNLVSLSGNFGFDLSVTAGGLLQTTPNQINIVQVPLILDGAGNVRPAQCNLRWSDDGGHVWKNYYQRNCGLLGEYRTRVKWERLGTSRDRIYEWSASDPINWRLVNAYLVTS